MISLPAALAPWSSQLSVFPSELGLAIGPLVQRIAAAIDPLHLEDMPGDDDPDGFDGLVNRGSYDRLIASDWLLADEIPEEFERRATMREHLFLKTAKRDRAHGLGSVVLFDAGPDQLGSPRLAHLAILVALIRRAERARANFSWGVLQNPGLPLLYGSNPSEITGLLRARTTASLSVSLVNDWIGRSVKAAKPEEVWLVGGTRLHQISPHHVVSRVKVEDVLEPGVRQVSVEVQRPKGRPKNLLLQLPENWACARLLRDPYQIGVSVPRKHSTIRSSAGLIFGHGGRRLFSRTGDGRLTSFPIANSPWAMPGRAKEHSLGYLGKIVAANRFGRSTIVVSREEVSLRISYVGRESYPPAGHYFLRADQFSWPKENDQGIFLCVRPPLPEGEKSNLLVLDASGNLFGLGREGEEQLALLEASGVLALTSVAGIPAYLSLDMEKRSVVYTSVGRQAFSGVVAKDCDLVERAFFGFSAQVKSPFCLMAVQKSPSHWRVISGPNRSIEIPTEAAQEIVGVIQEPNYAEALISLREDRHVVSLKGPDWERKLFESTQPITHLAVSLEKPWIAYVTTKGDVIVHSLTHGRTLCAYLNEQSNG